MLTVMMLGLLVARIAPQDNKWNRRSLLPLLAILALLAACGGDAFPTPDRDRAPVPTVATTPVGGASSGAERSGMDQAGVCQIVVPAGFTGDVAFWKDADASIILSAETIKAGDFAAYVAQIPGNVSSNPAIREYRQGAIEQTADSYSLQYSTAANPDDALYKKETTGIFVARLVSDTSVCSLLFLYPSNAANRYSPLREMVVNSLRKS